MRKNKIIEKTLTDKMYYIFGYVDKEIEKFRSNINDRTYSRDPKMIQIGVIQRNVKKYELLNALSLVGLKHAGEVFEILGLNLNEKDFEDGKKDK